ncbi:hypothetical protein [Microbulbifer epialgicus]|uniref:Uncharacterized protein n=1 Tax=Microbulbifer epialgicus TaxID=393907 RepID=A0ABV4NUD6_9GAMM
MNDTVNVSQIDIVSAILNKIHEACPNQLLSPCQVNTIHNAATMVLEVLHTREVRAAPGIGLEAWLRTEDVGASSKFMASILAQEHGIKAMPTHPIDPSDFARCRKLLSAVPELEDRLELMADQSEVWKRLVERWSEICELMDEEAPNWTSGEGRCPKTFSLMKELGC